MKADLNPKNNEWYRGVSGTWHHWQKNVLNGQMSLVVQGGDHVGGYWGNIVLGTDLHRDKIIYTAVPEEGSRVTFKTPELCASTIDNVWKEMVNGEVKIIEQNIKTRFL